MCGFAGFLGFDRLSPRDAYSVGVEMGNKLLHRGPDDGGLWCDEAIELILVHRRLAVVDLSSAGHQPMLSPSARYVIVFNGEVYNHKLLRDMLALEPAPGLSHQWIGHSDTETLLACIEMWGLEKTLQTAVGMFSLALYDRQNGILCLARDRMGEKPLYYGWQGNSFIFGSELKAFKSHPSFLSRINRSAITLLLRHNYIPTPYSIYENIYKLELGCILSIDISTRRESVVSYWSLANVALQDTRKISDSDAVDELHGLIKNAIGQQMIADVPLGAFLSGGIDSSTVVAIMQSMSTRPVKTFTIGFHESGYNEATYAKQIAEYLGTEHTELYVSPEQALAVIPKLPSLYDEPFSDSSQIPTFLVSSLAREHVTVSLSGDAGDELFGGYSRYIAAAKWWKYFSRCPSVIRSFAAITDDMLSRPTWINDGASVLEFLLRGNLCRRGRKTLSMLQYDNVSSFYQQFVSHWIKPESIVIGASEPSTIFSKSPIDLSDAQLQMQLLDSLSYLPDDILVKVDRAAMGVSLESRIPFLDHRIIEFAWSLPLDMKIRHGQGKWILRQVLKKYIPDVLFDRPKMGFGVPIDNWLRGPLRDWAEALLDESRIRSEGFLNYKPIRNKWSEHLSGRANHQYLLWDILMFQSWLEQEQLGEK